MNPVPCRSACRRLAACAVFVAWALPPVAHSQVPASVPAGPVLPPGPASAIAAPATPPPAPPDVTASNLAAVVNAYITNVTASALFRIYDPKGKKELFLQYVRADDEVLRPIGRAEFVVSAEFESEDGTEYLLDFYARGDSAETLNVGGGLTSIQAVDGEPRYTWQKHERYEFYLRRLLPEVTGTIPPPAPETEEAEEAPAEELSDSATPMVGTTGAVVPGRAGPTPP